MHAIPLPKMTPDEARAQLVAAVGNYSAMRIHDFAQQGRYESEEQKKDRDEWEARNGTPEEAAIRFLDNAVLEYLPLIIAGRDKK
ncbi:hypothetical protein KITKAT_9 [Arthrobacter phage Kitkat]|uniref:Uncharacterized protein n=1 Tax=Arthrobacter phage Kitkat TaxID=1796996 RepID=A0A140G6T0_9CAUD|nr:hypothetical protein BJD77_gp009 [Arthrobacter phage Kitkat]AMM44365.1 hypothetical protein KITKAT_9 [Arthrobacter phage Kitkat]